MLHPAAECLNREPELAAINRAVLDVQRPIRAVLFPRTATGDPPMYERARYGMKLHFQKVVQGRTLTAGTTSRRRMAR